MENSCLGGIVEDQELGLFALLSNPPSLRFHTEKMTIKPNISSYLRVLGFLVLLAFALISYREDSSFWVVFYINCAKEFFKYLLVCVCSSVMEKE